MQYTLLILAIAAAALATSAVLSAINTRLMNRRLTDLEGAVAGLIKRITIAAGRVPTPQNQALTARELGELAATDDHVAELRAAGGNAASNALRACRAEHGSIVGIGRNGWTCVCGWLHAPGDHVVCRDGQEHIRRCNVCGNWFHVHQLVLKSERS